MPGCYKLAGALRDQGLLLRLRARDAGVVTPPRYRSAWDRKTVRNAGAIASYSRALADRVGRVLERGEFPIVLGGDCSILLGNMLALRRRGRHGLVFIDGHLDFRHPGNAPAVGAAAGEDLALVTGRGARELVDIDRLVPYVEAADVAALGFRARDEYAGEAAASGITLVEAPRLDAETARAAVAGLDVDGFWVHLDVDVLDAQVMPAVDTPEPDGPDYAELMAVLRAVLADGRARGFDVTAFDPDLDPDGTLAGRLADALVTAFV